MIKYDEVISSGSVLRSHGVDGEIVIPVATELLESSEMHFIVLEMDGILVPFFIESFRRRGAESSIVKLEGIDTPERAENLRGRKLWLLKSDLVQSGAEDFISPDILIGMAAEDSSLGYIGEIADVDDSTPNILLLVRNGEREYIIPASSELIGNVDIRSGTVLFSLPEGLLDI